MEINTSSASSNVDTKNKKKKNHNKKSNNSNSSGINRTNNNNSTNISNKNNPKALNDDNLNKSKNNKFKRLNADSNMPLDSTPTSSSSSSGSNSTATNTNPSNSISSPVVTTTKPNKNVIKKQTVSVKTKLITTQPSTSADLKSTSSTSSSSSSSNLSDLEATSSKFKSLSIETTGTARLVTLNDRNEIKIIDENTLKSINFIKPCELFQSTVTTTATTTIPPSLSKTQPNKTVDSSSASAPKTQLLSECMNNKSESNLKKLEAEFENNFVFKAKKVNP